MIVMACAPATAGAKSATPAISSAAGSATRPPSAGGGRRGTADGLCDVRVHDSGPSKGWEIFTDVIRRTPLWCILRQRSESHPAARVQSLFIYVDVATNLLGRTAPYYANDGELRGQHIFFADGRKSTQFAYRVSPAAPSRMIGVVLSDPDKESRRGGLAHDAMIAAAYGHHVTAEQAQTHPAALP